MVLSSYQERFIVNLNKLINYCYVMPFIIIIFHFWKGYGLKHLLLTANKSSPIRKIYPKALTSLFQLKYEMDRNLGISWLLLYNVHWKVGLCYCFSASTYVLLIRFMFLVLIEARLRELIRLIWPGTYSVNTLPPLEGCL